MLTQTEKKTAQSLKKEFVQVKDRIHLVEEQMKSLNSQTESLINHLEDLRLQEKNFMDQLKEKYGPGKLNPLTLSYEKL
jgi:hypothetical protein